GIKAGPDDRCRTLGGRHRVGVGDRLATLGDDFGRDGLGRGRVLVVDVIGILADVVDHDLGPARGQKLGVGPPETRVPSGPRDDGYPAVEPKRCHWCVLPDLLGPFRGAVTPAGRRRLPASIPLLRVTTRTLPGRRGCVNQPFGGIWSRPHLAPGRPARSGPDGEWRGTPRPPSAAPTRTTRPPRCPRPRGSAPPPRPPRLPR